MSEPKQMLIWRNDLRNVDGHKVRSGKMAAQLAHASMAAILNLGGISYGLEGLGGTRSSDFIIPLDHKALYEWLEGRFTKICVSVDSEQELTSIINQAKDAGLITSLITDAGLTEFGGIPTVTCGAVGPAYPEQVDKLTGHLKLL